MLNCFYYYWYICTEFYWDIINIQHCIHFSCTTEWFDGCVSCENVTTISLVNIHHLAHYHFLFVARTLKISSLSNCQIYNTVLLTRVWLVFNDYLLFLDFYSFPEVLYLRLFYLIFTTVSWGRYCLTHILKTRRLKLSKANDLSKVTRPALSNSRLLDLLNNWFCLKQDAPAISLYDQTKQKRDWW